MKPYRTRRVVRGRRCCLTDRTDDLGHDADHTAIGEATQLHPCGSRALVSVVQFVLRSVSHVAPLNARCRSGPTSPTELSLAMKMGILSVLLRRHGYVFRCVGPWS